VWLAEPENDALPPHQYALMARQGGAGKNNVITPSEEYRQLNAPIADRARMDVIE
jgi:hypothetical protein